MEAQAESRGICVGILEELQRDETWDAFLQYKLAKNHLSNREKEAFALFIEEKRYKTVTEHLTDDGYCFDYPVKLCVNKSSTGKKRVVYSYSETESMVLKAMAFLLYRYDDKISPSCYSFRRSYSVKDALTNVLALPGLSGKYCLKVDIHNYFNSIPPASLVATLREIITDDDGLLAFLERLLLADTAYENGALITESRGAMAGTPISPFFANIYLLSLDNLFAKEGIPYFRYSDDILLFADSLSALNRAQSLLQSHIAKKGLTLNPKKVHISAPGEPWEFLGFCYKDGILDLSTVTVDKMKAKIRRKAHSLYRWRTKKNADFERTARAMIRTFNKKFYDEQEENAFTWSRWFFPLLHTSESLKELDAYMLQYIRYLYSGRHYKGNYRITYDQIKSLGYRSLVHEYYLFKSCTQK